MSHFTRFIIENDSKSELSVWVESEAFPVSLLPDETVVVEGGYDREPVTIRVWQDDTGASAVSIWPGDSEMVVTKDGRNVLR